ncbi:K(+)-transporting ATPase subunit C [Flavihumibacter fluvii]|uniref:K(+)-transporting ATPase subunit C n=1 Tax=Flavihumibacter fluvii TaxID=2838157 RepID=UPI001BDE7659|nr:K(+)-transporting ATPase subunit C [Flavihumibacter fluvii]ULQ51209.1 K(+)-transporting ATPase subunit C [Flavihumibacter fluvii]
MKKYFGTAVRLTLVMIVLLAVCYPLLIAGIGKLAPGKGKGETVTLNGTVVGYTLVGQKFTDDKFFRGRPSAVDYNAAGSGGSNKGATNPDYLQQVKDRIDTFMVHNPGIQKSDIPAEMVTASGSGLDPDISPAGALIQVKRIAAVRNLQESEVTKLVELHIEKPFLGLFGPAKVNVLKLNVALEQVK